MANELSISDAFKQFAALSPEKREAFVLFLENEPPLARLDSLIDRAAKKTEIRKDLVAAVLNGLSGLIAVVANNESLRRLMVSFFTESGENSPPVHGFDAQVDRILQCEHSIGLTAKAQAVMWGHGNVYSGSRTITQIRPLFLTDLSTNCREAVIVHDLKLQYRSNGSDVSFSLAMSFDQLGELEDAIKRARSKEKSLREYKAFQYLEDRDQDEGK